MRAYDLNRPTPGHYLIKLTRGGPDVPVRIARLCSCTINGGDDNAGHEWREDCDRHPPIRAWLGGEEVEMARVWPYAARRPITADEYAYRLAVRAWAVEHAPDAPEARPREAVNLNTMPPILP